jgi:hypothetical protein
MPLRLVPGRVTASFVAVPDLGARATCKALWDRLSTQCNSAVTTGARGVMHLRNSFMQESACAVPRERTATL